MTHTPWLRLAMLGSILLVGTVMFLDEQREFERALEDLQEEQRALVTAVAADFESRLMDAHESGWLPTGPLEPQEMQSLLRRLLGGATELEQPGSRLLLVSVPGQGLFRLAGSPVNSSDLEQALQANKPGVTLSREAAAALGLPHRLAVAGLRQSRVAQRAWGIVLVSSGQRLRARERHAQVRFLSGLLVVTLLVAGFGGLALRDQRRKFEAARALEVAALQREAERLLTRADKMATLAALSSGIAHQIATPLGTIVARVEQVLPAVEGMPKATLALQVVSEQVMRIQRIIHGVLDLARGHRPTLASTRPAAVAQSALGLVQHRMAAAKVRVELDAPHELPCIACDPPMLEQALVNLLLNACEASEPGAKIALRVESRADQVRFVVEDQGEGISDEIAARAREPFFTTKARVSGTGLGLAIAHEVVAHHGGSLSLGRRGQGPGTRAIIELPVHNGMPDPKG